MLEYYGAARRFKYLPTETEELLVFPFNAFTFEFDTSSYHPDKTNHRLTTKELQRFLAGINLILQDHKKVLYKENNAKNTTIFLILIFVGAMINGIVIPATGNVDFLGVGLGVVFVGMVFWFVNLMKQVNRAKKIRKEAKDRTI